jgi:hypothetical protein
MVVKMQRVVLLLMAFLTASAASAQPVITLPKPVKGKLAELVPVTAPSATCLAIGEASSWLAFGHDVSYKEAQVSLVRLDAKGVPAAYSIPLKLPPVAPTLAAKFASYPLALAFHPKLPLLYVWQEINVPFGNPPAPPLPGLEQFDHLLIYNVAKGTPELVVGLCRGPYFLYGMGGGGLAVDKTGSYLYVPNMKDPKNYGNFLFGRFTLDEAGLPKLDDKEAKLPAAARPKRLADLNAAKPVLPHQITPHGFTTFFSFNTFGCGFGFHTVSKDVVVAGAWNGLITWQPDDPRLQVAGFSLRHSGNKFLGAHPDLPVLFVTIASTDALYRVEHIDGLATLVPERWTFADEILLSPPVVLPKSKKLVVGGRYHVNVVSLDDQGRCRPEVVQVPVFSPTVRALAYSERFERVFTAVEVSK